MRAVVQRVSRGRVTVEGNEIAAIDKGLVILLGVSEQDTLKDCEYLSAKIVNLRIFPDNEEKMNLSLKDIGGEMLIVSQFTLLGDCRKGRRPSFVKAALPLKANQLYLHFVDLVKKQGVKTAQGEFQAMMMVEIVNDGPVTLLLDSNKEF